MLVPYKIEINFIITFSKVRIFFVTKSAKKKGPQFMFRSRAKKT
jgi:hypothetical protein